ncbi:glucose-1-phosphate cytidylyltransferase [Laspinema sp. A4]|uniref:glucose-1-phosphate cytidylyltransferase n=1 Tax=Laspinema sp. D2d TaxID=2953686 RepID=UPI0021BA6E9D|nr:glucose-1-phosphate cytidylyltransferase [Laspinema sp. D2d]MCT7983603.1 glucose-1-phosphate cytidylyltransferase [Laspinema sp. D2d]
MKAVILAGGYGTRLSEETHLKPKPMVEIGERPILWHIMKSYSAYGVNNFIICCGYKGYIIKEYFANYFLHMSDVTFDMQSNQMEVHHKHTEPWRVTLVDTGENTLTGGRLKRVKDYVGNETFCFTYGDGVSDIDISKLINYHQKNGLLATITAVQPPGRYGALNIDPQGRVLNFQEKPQGDGGWINGGYFVLEPQVFDFIEGDKTSWESDPLQEIARKNQLTAFNHYGFWQPMDTLRDRNLLEELWCSGQAPWKVW